MARLNEGPPANEEAELIKRRVMRQNHELAKANSRLAQAIRSATTDTTRIEAENIELREIIVHLEAKLAESQRCKGLSRVEQIKTDLQSKLDDMAGLIASIGSAQDQKPDAGDRSRRSTSYDSREPQLRFAMQPYGLSPIPESHALPDFGTDDDHFGLGRMSDQSIDSSDFDERPLSPMRPLSLASCSPTKTFLVHTDAVRGDSDEHTTDDNNALPTDLSINLEVRRKRKDSGRSSNARTSLPTFDAEEKPFKIPKRKLSMREVDDVAPETTAEDFTYSIRHATEAQPELSEPVTDTDREVRDEKPDLPLPQPERRALGDKSVNMSPRKRAATDKPTETANEKGNALEAECDRKERKERKRPAKSSHVAKPTASRRNAEKGLEGLMTVLQVGHAANIVPKIVEILPDELNIPSSDTVEDADPPTPSPEPSAGSTDSMEQPTNIEAGSRPSRRARGAVSYAEPSLNTKLRRPTKELVAAVYSKTTDRTSISSAQDIETVIKTEAVENEAWRDLPAPARRRSSLPRQSSGAHRRSVSLGNAQGQDESRTDELQPTKRVSIDLEDSGLVQYSNVQDIERTGSPSLRQKASRARRHTSQIAVTESSPGTSADEVSRGALRRSLSNSEQKAEVKTHVAPSVHTASRRRSTVV